MTPTHMLILREDYGNLHAFYQDPRQPQHTIHVAFREHVTGIEYRLSGVMHREEGPARLHYGPDGGLFYVEYIVNGNRHRTEGPAIIEYHDNGAFEHVSYYRHGKMHREGGPASAFYSREGGLRAMFYYLNGVHQ